MVNFLNVIKNNYFILGLLIFIALVLIFFNYIQYIGDVVFHFIIGGIPDDPNRIDILALGIRGIGDKNGGLLSDSIILLSIYKPTGKIAMFSIPRDLYIEMPGKDYKEKINFAYALGYEEGKDGLDYAKKAVSSVTGVNMDYSVAIDLDGFSKLIDVLGGIDVNLDKPFIEDKQWHDDSEFASSSGAFILPAGRNHLDSKKTLYYIRSRFSSSDFDRAHRQQQVLVAVKEKMLQLNILTDYSKIKNIYNLLKKNIETNISLSDVLEFLPLISKLDVKNIKTKVFSTAPDGFLYESNLKNGTYILLPVGDNFYAIQQYIKTIFKN